jgi:hypothetical protein
MDAIPNAAMAATRRLDFTDGTPHNVDGSISSRSSMLIRMVHGAPARHRHDLPYGRQWRHEAIFQLFRRWYCMG